ncbi:hypothetical protein FACS1894167_05250 [Synergistales bacterium]|nr:hypothetical protein FACS1894167_05250 [Synergistales bacterium]
MKVIVFGAGVCGRKYIENCPGDVEIVAVADNNWEALGGGYLAIRSSLVKIPLE